MPVTATTYRMRPAGKISYPALLNEPGSRFEFSKLASLMPRLCGVAIALLLTACGGSSGNSGSEPDIDTGLFDPDTNSSCETGFQNQWAYNNMLDYYLFYDQVPVVDPQSFDSPEDLVRAVRFQERDPFSSLTDAAASSLAFEAGREFGLGYNWAYDNDDRARLTRVVNDSPFGRAGLERGDIIINLDGTPWDEVPSDNFRANVFGTPDSPATTMWVFEKRDDAQRVTVEVTATEYSINTVLHTEILTNPEYSGSVGYLAFSRFLETSADELRTVFNEFNNQNITDLVLDLRYNSGGRVVIAEQLASLVAGDSRANQLLYQYEFNDKYTSQNYSLRFLEGIGDLGLTRVIVLTRGRTASASEIVIGGLQPYMDVITMGSTTSGKPYVQRGRTRCGRQLNAIEGEGFNAAGNSVFGGVPATCYAQDDVTRDFGFDADTGKLEGMLESGLDYLLFGTCLTEPINAASLSVKTGQSPTDKHAVANNDSEHTKQGFVDIGGAVR